MRSLPQFALLMLLTAAIFSVGYYTGRSEGTGPQGLAPPDTDSVATAQPDTSAPAVVPWLVTVYDTVRTTNTVRETVRVPTGFDLEGVIGDRPIRRETRIFGPDRYTLTYFDPEARRYIQKSYEAGRPTWALWPEIEVRTTPWGLEATSLAAVRWRDWTVAAGYTASARRRGWTAALRWRPLTITP